MLHEIGSKSTCKRLIIKLSYPKKHGDVDVAYLRARRETNIQHSEKSIVNILKNNNCGGFR
jgi:hypothetical protein